MKKEPNSIASLTLGIIKVFSSSRAQSANATKRSGVQFFPFTSAFNSATTGWRKAKPGAVYLLLCLLKKLLYGLSQQSSVFKHRKSRAIKRPADSSFCRSNRLLCRNIRQKRIIRTLTYRQGSYYSLMANPLKIDTFSILKNRF